MTFYYHWVVSDELSNPPTLTELTDFVRGEICEGGFGPYENLRVTWFREVKYNRESTRRDERAYKARVSGPYRDIKLVRDNLVNEYGRLTPSKIDFPDDGLMNMTQRVRVFEKGKYIYNWQCERGHFHATKALANDCNHGRI